MNEDNIEPNEFIVGCYGYLSKRYTEEETVIKGDSKEKMKKEVTSGNILMGFGFIIGQVEF